MAKRISQSGLDAKISRGARVRKSPLELAKEESAKTKEAIESVSRDMRSAAAAMIQSNANSGAVVNSMIAAMETRIAALIEEMNQSRAVRLVIERDYDDNIKYIDVVPKHTKH